METRHCNDFGFQPSLQDSDILADLPATEVAGYFQTAAPAARAKKQVLRGAPSQGSVARLRMTNQEHPRHRYSCAVPQAAVPFLKPTLRTSSKNTLIMNQA